MFEGVGIIEPHHFISICAEFCTKKCAQNELNPKNEMTLIQMSAFLGNEVYFQKSCNVCEYLQLLTQLHPLPSRALHVPFQNSCKKDRNAKNAKKRQKMQVQFENLSKKRTKVHFQNSLIGPIIQGVVMFFSNIFLGRILVPKMNILIKVYVLYLFICM